MNLPLVVAGALALLGAAIHGIVGELVVVRRLSPPALPSSPFGGSSMTKAMIRASWHLTTTGFLTVGAALVASGSVLHGEVARAVGFVAACASTGFAAVVMALGAREWFAHRPHRVPRHPAIVVLPAVPVLAWWGIS